MEPYGARLREREKYKYIPRAKRKIGSKYEPFKGRIKKRDIDESEIYEHKRQDKKRSRIHEHKRQDEKRSINELINDNPDSNLETFNSDIIYTSILPHNNNNNDKFSFDDNDCSTNTLNDNIINADATLSPTVTIKDPSISLFNSDNKFSFDSNDCSTNTLNDNAINSPFIITTPT